MCCFEKKETTRSEALKKRLTKIEKKARDSKRELKRQRKLSRQEHGRCYLQHEKNSKSPGRGSGLGLFD